VKLVHREFPLPTHAHALEAAKIAQGAKALNKYNAVADALFKDQADWGVTGNMTKTLLAALSTSELDRVRQAAEDPAVMKQIEADKAAGQAEGVNQTPTMVIRHKGQKYPIAGIVTYEVFSKFLDNLLNS
jgi:protein-disulfide isomerase